MPPKEEQPSKISKADLQEIINQAFTSSLATRTSRRSLNTREGIAGWAVELAISLSECNAKRAHLLNVIEAFRKHRDEEEVKLLNLALTYCGRQKNPVGLEDQLKQWEAEGKEKEGAKGEKRGRGGEEGKGGKGKKAKAAQPNTAKEDAAKLGQGKEGEGGAGAPGVAA